MRPETWRCCFEGRLFVVRDRSNERMGSGRTEREAVLAAIATARQLGRSVRIVDGSSTRQTGGAA